MSLITRLLIAFTTLPNRESWLLGVTLLGFYGLVAFFWGFKRDFLQFQVLQSPLKIAQIIIVAFFAPALLEEIVFRFYRTETNSQQQSDSS
jgi:predicted Abi (CAAX) family protease